MMRRWSMIFALLTVYQPAWGGAGMHMPTTLHKFDLKHLEIQSDDSAMVHLEAWHGDELNKLNWSLEWQKFDEHKTLEASLGYVWPLDAFWDSGPVFSFEQESEPGEDESEPWLGWQFKGTAPYFIHVDAKTLLGRHSQLKLEVELEHEFPLGRHWLLESKFEIEAGRFQDSAGHDTEIESWSAGWRLQYETVDRFKYYVGTEYTDDHHSDSKQWRVLSGLSWWW